jgi:hypothetical protein
MDRHAIGWLILVLASAGSTHVAAQIEEGKCEKYLDFTPAAGVQPDYPALKIDDLRKLTLYSKLMIRGSQAVIADDKYLRRLEPHPQDSGFLLATSDHFQFTILKDGNLVAAGVPPASRKALQFLWIKHATNESPDGKPWLKDLVLLPFDKKTGKLLNPWPFAMSAAKRSDENDEPAAFLRFGDPNPERAKLPAEDKCVVGTFAAGNTNYLVLDVFGGYGWWGKTASLEFVALRGAKPVDIDKFHALVKGPPKVVPGQWRNPRLNSPNETIGTSQQSLKALEKKLAAAYQVAVRSEPTQGWEDLLLLEEENRPLKPLDDLVTSAKTFGDIVDWACVYLEKRDGSSEIGDWFGPLDERLAKDDKNAIVAARSVRYMLRRHGFPAQILGFHRKQAWGPTIFVHAYVPSQALSIVFMFGSRTFTAFAAEAPFLYNLPTNPNSFRGKTPAAEIRLGGGKARGTPFPESF